MCLVWFASVSPVRICHTSTGYPPICVAAATGPSWRVCIGEKGRTLSWTVLAQYRVTQGEELIGIGIYSFLTIANLSQVLSDLVESTLGALYVSDDYSPVGAEKFFNKVFKPFYDRHITLQTLSHHPTKVLFELIQARGSCQKFQLVKEHNEYLGKRLELGTALEWSWWGCMINSTRAWCCACQLSRWGWYIGCQSRVMFWLGCFRRGSWLPSSDLWLLE